jgi:long-chain fatty acid transport protein
MKIKGAALLCFVLLTITRSFAGGFQINEHSARATGLGGAFTGIADDPSAIYFNGAGITQLDGTAFLAGTTLIAPISSFRGVYPSIDEYKMKKQIFFPSYFYATHKINNKLWVGLGFNSPYGLGTQWDDNWAGRNLAIETSVKTFVFYPTIAYKVLDNLSVSAALNYAFASVKITRKTPQTPFAGEAYVNLEGTDNTSFGYNLGVLYKPTDKLSIGISYRSQMEYNFDGTATTTGAQELIDAKKLPNSKISADLTTPVNITVGAAYKVTPELQISADFQYVGWSSYDTLKVNFNDPSYSDIASPRVYENSYLLRLGAEYKVNESLSAQAGIQFDKNPVKPDYLNPSLVDADRLGLSIGLGYKITKNMGANLAYLLMRGAQTTVSNSTQNYLSGVSPFNGTYNSTAYIVSLSLSYSL